MKHVLKTILPFLLLLTACTSTNITSSWNADEVTKKDFNKILIVGLIQDKDRNLREQMEKQLASELASKGYAVTTAFKEYGPKAFEGLTEKEALRKLRSGGVDGVITISLLDKNKEERYVPGSVLYRPFAVRYNRFWGYYTAYYDRIYSPGYYDTNTKYFFETNLYDVKSNEVLYSVQSETFDPASAERLAVDYAKTIVKDIQKKDLLDKKS